MLQELLQNVSSLQTEVTQLKKDNMPATSRTYPQKRLCDGNKDVEGDTEATHDGENTLSEGAGDSDAHKEEDAGEEDPKFLVSYKLSEEGEAFLETVFTSKLRYQTRQARVAKYGLPDSRWTKCPELSPVVQAILSKEAVKQDKVTFRSQEMWLEAAEPLTSSRREPMKGH